MGRPNKTDREPLLKCRDIARMLNLSEVLIRAYVQRRKIPFYRIGRSVRFSAKEVQQWLSDNAVSPVNKPGEKEV